MIRRPNENDLDALRIFFDLVIRDTYTKEGVGHLIDDIRNEIESKIDYVKEDIRTNGEKYYFLLYVENDKIIGTAAIGPSSHLIYDHIKELKTCKELGSVLIAPVYQNRGIGSKLVSEIEQAISEKYSEFCLDSGYTIAKKIWSKRYGSPRKILKDFWAPGIDHYIWHIKFPLQK